MKLVASLLLAVLLLSCVSEGKKKGPKSHNPLVRKLKTHKKNLAIILQPNYNDTSTMSSKATRKPTRKPTTVEVNEVKVLPTKRIMRTPHFSRIERRCCKLGIRGARKGYNCDWDRFTASRYTNMEHRMKMKFQIRKPSKRTTRYVHHVVNFCVKTGLKSLFRKCCTSYTK